MRYLRMISSINHWDKNKMDLYPNCFSTGDILFSELKTEKNTLSLWGFSDDTEIDDLVVAIALSRQHIQKLVYVIMDDEKINKLGIPLVPERGDADGMVNEAILNKHVNLAKIDFWRLGYVADYLCDLVKEDNTHNTVTEKRLFALIKDSVNAGTVVVDQMSDAMRTSYQNHLKEEAEKAARAAARNV